MKLLVFVTEHSVADPTVDALLEQGFRVTRLASTGGFLRKPEGRDYGPVGPDLMEPKYFGYGAGIALRKGDLKYALPFGTFLAAGAGLAATVGPGLVRWYLGFYKPL